MKPAHVSALVSLALGGTIVLAILLLRPGSPHEEGSTGAGEVAGASHEGVAPEPERSPALEVGEPARPPGLRPRAAPIVTQPPLEPPPALPLPVGTASVRFQITQGATALPIPDVEVTLRSGRAAGTRRTDRQGAARFTGVRPGTFSYSLLAHGYPELESARTLELLDGQELEVAVRLSSFESSISGLVKDESGQPVGGIVVTARKALEEADVEDLVRTGEGGLIVTTGIDGAFALGGLEAADYVISTEPTAIYPSVRRVYRAGVDTAELVVKASSTLRFFGHVRSTVGAPIAGARIRVVGVASSSTTSDVDGSYELQTQASVGSTYVLSAAAGGFAEGRLNIPFERAEEGLVREVDITLDPIGAVGAITGVVEDSEGQPVHGETVYVLSPSRSARFQTKTGVDGAFRIPDVPVGDDYKLWLYPRKEYGDFAQSPLVVTEAGVELEIILGPLARGTLVGDMVDLAGGALPELTLWARSLKALGNSIVVASDARGAFRVEGVPEGELVLETRSLPRLSVRGVRIEPNARTYAKLVLDWGRLRLAGAVVDEAGAPIAGAQVALAWSHSEGELESSSYRNCVSDADGRFEFSALGPGLHKVSVNAAGYAPLQQGHEVGAETPDAVVRLQAAPRGRR